LVGKGRVNGGSIDVDFSDDALYADYTLPSLFIRSLKKRSIRLA
jgi:hypothetical protein